MNALPATAVDRLMASRERLRKVLYGKSGKHLDDNRENADGTADWLSKLEAIPGASVIIDAARAWWAQHPLRQAGTLAVDATVAVVRPLAQRHPVKLVLGAFVAGVLIAWMRPWRWLPRPALLSGLFPHILEKAVAELPVQSWLVVLTSLAQEDQPALRSNPAPQDSVQTQASP
jgi:hypothetical protein